MRNRTLALGTSIILVVVLVTLFVQNRPKQLTADLSNSGTRARVRACADINPADGTLNLKEMRTLVIDLVVAVAAGQQGCDADGDGVTSRPDVSAAINALKDFLAGTCGNSMVESGEECDDSNTAIGDGCDDVCAVESGFTCTGEPSECVPSHGAGGSSADSSSSDSSSSDSSSSGGSSPVCGDGVQVDPEECDDGNQDNTDLCTTMCKDAVCGDSFLQQNATGEECDDSNTVDGDGCSRFCTFQVPIQSVTIDTPDYDRVTVTLSRDIGTVFYWANLYNAAGENLGSLGQQAGVTAVLRFPFGSLMMADGGRDFRLDVRECPLIASDAEVDWCGPVFSKPITFVNGRGLCGEGHIQGTEECDDGSNVDGDGCDAVCSIEPGFDCTGEPSQCSPIGGSSSSDSSSSSSSDGGGGGGPVCGDGVIEPFEQCDDANTTNGDGCHADCSKEADFHCSGQPSVCISYLEFVRRLADKNSDGIVSDFEGLALMIELMEVPLKPFNEVQIYDIDGNGVVDSTDVTIILNFLGQLLP